MDSSKKVNLSKGDQYENYSERKKQEKVSSIKIYFDNIYSKFFIQITDTNVQQDANN